MAYLLGFNNNIRCIEILLNRRQAVHELKFNNNIRCIEISEILMNIVEDLRLITT